MIATPQKPAPLLLTTRDVQERLQIGRNLAFRMIADGTLPVVRIGKRRRVPSAALDRWLEAQTHQSA